MSKTIGVFFGGKSPEHDVSIITGQFIISGLKKLGYNVAPVYLDKNGEWFLGDDLGALSFFKDKNRNEKLKKMAKFSLDLGESKDKLVFKKTGLSSKKYIIDIAFPAFHGKNGEDGTIQGLFEIFNIPYVGCDVASSAIAIDKGLTKLFYKANDFPTTEFFAFKKIEWEKSKNEILEKIKTKLSWPIFIKPASLGSSIGMAKVEDKDELLNAIEVALHYDEKFLAEAAVENLADITCACLGDNETEASLIQESSFSKDFFSYEDKYLEDGGAQLGQAEKNIIIPANLPRRVTKEARAMTQDIFRKLGCSGIARIDFLYDRKKEKLYANEINTLPGTLYHHLWEKSGVKFGDLLARLIELAGKKHEQKQKTSHVFDSEILNQANQVKLQLKNT